VAALVDRALEPKTQAGYESILAAHLTPEFGDRRVSTITPERVEAYIRRLSDDGMAAGTVRSVYAALRAALNTAVRLRMISNNPCIGAKPRARRTAKCCSSAPRRSPRPPGRSIRTSTS
jgi:site-specific recombinase XerC